MISLVSIGILKMSWFVHIVLQNKHMVPIVYALLRSYLNVYGYFRFFSYVTVQTLRWWLLLETVYFAFWVVIVVLRYLYLTYSNVHDQL